MLLPNSNRSDAALTTHSPQAQLRVRAFQGCTALEHLVLVKKEQGLTFTGWERLRVEAASSYEQWISLAAANSFSTLLLLQSSSRIQLAHVGPEEESLRDFCPSYLQAL